MDVLETEILKYEKKSFKIVHRRTLKHGTRTYLRKEIEGFILSEYRRVYLYYVNGDCSTESMRECFKDYAKFYEDHEFDTGDKGFLLCSGRLDEKMFKDLRKAMIRDDEIRSTIKPLALQRESNEKIIQEAQPSKKEEKKRLETSEGIDFQDVLEKVRSFYPHTKPRNEKELENMLVSYLSAYYHRQIRTQLAYEKSRIDAQIDNIGIELKYQPNAGAFNTLWGQVEGYSRHLDKIIIVIGFEKSKEDTEMFRQRLKDRGWLNSKVFLVLIN